MDLASHLDQQITGTGSITAQRPDGSRAEAEVLAAGPVGVRLRRLRVEHATPRDVAAEADRLPEALAGLVPVVPLEVAPALGGAVLRTPREQVREGRYFEVQLAPGAVEITRHRATAEGRATESWDLTREQLRALVEGIEAAPSPAAHPAAPAPPLRDP
ncbi:MAG: hypothetical protein JXX28_16690 [Deltaproteobacteria bacterium]|nr:hypothetical protein [Deltaproteobacteria bacterium]